MKKRGRGRFFHAGSQAPAWEPTSCKLQLAAPGSWSFQNRIPKLEHLLGVILANKADYAGAAEHMKNYIERAPDAADIETVRKQLVEIEKLVAGRAAAPPQ